MRDDESEIAVRSAIARRRPKPPLGVAIRGDPATTIPPHCPRARLHGHCAVASAGFRARALACVRFDTPAARATSGA
jgi:hypothetical protein